MARAGGNRRTCLVVMASALIGLLGAPGAPALFHAPADLAVPAELRDHLASGSLADPHSAGARMTVGTYSALRGPPTLNGAGAGHPASRSAASLIDPLSGRTSEPAPMGIADFGVTGVGPSAQAYSYTTDSFEGTANVNTMSLTITGTSSHLAAFELNAMVVLRLGGVNYTYWIQNGLHIDSSTDEFTIGGAYVWNFSSPSAHLGVGELRGDPSSTLVTDTYYFIPNCGVFAGQCSTVSFPLTLTGRINVSMENGLPTVDYQYNLGNGWVTYDSVAFAHFAAASIEGFVVDGYTPTPYASLLFYDAEWDWVGAGGGSSGRDVSSDLTMTLQYWNGHNYQAVPDAWDFGGDTGESSSGVLEARTALGPQGAPAAHLTNGSGTLGMLYNGTNTGTVLLSIPWPIAGGVLDVNGTPTSFVGSEANLTLAAGIYTLSLAGYSNATATVSIGPSQVVPIGFPDAGRTTFHEVGLPSGTVWEVTVGAFNASAGQADLTLHLPNGTYAVGYPAIPGFTHASTAPKFVTVPVSGTVTVAWTVFTFTVPVIASGLPSGVAWWITVNGTGLRGTGTTLQVGAPNGTTPYAIGTSYDFVAAPASGEISITAGAVTPVEVEFSYRPTWVAGSVSPASATVTVGGSPQSVTNGMFNDSVLPGNYTVVVSAPGFITDYANITASPGNTSSVQLSLTAVTPGPPAEPSPAASAGFPLWVAVVAGAAVVAVAGAGLVLWRRRRAP